MAQELRPRRIYTGPQTYDTVKTHAGTKTVQMNGSVQHAVASRPGSSVACTFANMAMDNPDVFPHPVKYAVFTKSTALIVDKIRRGRPAHGFLYSHDLGPLVDMNDRNEIKRAVADDPRLIEKPFLLKPYVPAVRRGGTATGTSGRVSPKLVIKRGQLARLVKAGILHDGAPG